MNRKQPKPMPNSDILIVGIDPSLRGLGISDGTRHEVIKTMAGENLDDRIDDLIDGIWRFAFLHRDVVPKRQMWVVEAPLLAQMSGGAGLDGSHLYEAGNLMRAIRSELVETMRDHGVELTYLEVQIGTLRRFTTGCGNAPKHFLAYMVEQIHGMTFEKDPGLDKLIAWSLVQYGRAVYGGEELHQFAAPRGQGKKTRAIERKKARTRAASA